jgi:uncharacterized protein YbjT (DUF2867 family)
LFRTRTGFVGSHVVEQLLEHGYRVRGTARSTSKLDSLKKRWDEKYPGKFEVAIVEDILAKDAFNEVTKGEFLPYYLYLAGRLADQRNKSRM